jgi:hypothetical protein
VGSPSLPDTYYKANDPDGDETGTRANLNSLLKGNIKPDWETARTWESESVLGTEVAARLKRPVKYAVQIEDSGTIESETVQSPYVWVIFNENRASGALSCFVASLLPDASYSGDVSRLGSNPEGSDFWGVAIYSSTDGTPAWGWRYENGEITTTLYFGTAHQNRTDPNIRIFMGFGYEAATRSWYTWTDQYGNTVLFKIEEVECVGTREDPISIVGIWEVPGYEHIKPGGGTGGGGGGGSGGSGGSGGGSQNPMVNVHVPNNNCVMGTFAAALQAKYGVTAMDAIENAQRAMSENGIYPFTSLLEPDGVSLLFSDLVAALRDMGIIVIGGLNPPQYVIISIFNEGGWGIGTILPGAGDNWRIGHQIFLTGYEPSTDSYSYYDSTKYPGNNTGRIPASSIEEFLIK